MLSLNKGYLSTNTDENFIVIKLPALYNEYTDQEGVCATFELTIQMFLRGRVSSKLILYIVNNYPEPAEMMAGHDTTFLIELCRIDKSLIDREIELSINRLIYLGKTNTDMLNYANSEGKTALYYLCASGNERCLRRIMDHDNLRIQPATIDGSSALHCAVQNGQYHIIGHIIENRLVLDSIDKEQRTALSYMCEQSGGESYQNWIMRDYAIEYFCSGMSTVDTRTQNSSLILAIKNNIPIFGELFESRNNAWDKGIDLYDYWCSLEYRDFYSAATLKTIETICNLLAIKNYGRGMASRLLDLDEFLEDIRSKWII